MPRKRSQSSDRSLSDSDRRKRSKHKRNKKHIRRTSSESSSPDRHHHSHHKRGAKHRRLSKEHSKRESVRDETSKKRDQRKRKDESSLTKQKQKPKDESVIEDTIAQAGDISLSIAETNKLREKLGLKPLETDDDAANKLKTTEVHVPPKNIGDVENSEKIREKIATVKEKRLLEEKLSAVQPVASKDDSDLPTSEWIKQFEEKLVERQMKEEKQKLLEQADEELELDSIVSVETQRQLSQRYDSADLKGLRVEHSQDLIKEGRPVILTLKDSEILKDEEDVLVNVNIVDDSQAKRNALLRQKKFSNDQQTEETFEKSLLSKYDEEIHGRKVESFVLGDEGKFDPEEEKARQLAHERLTSSAISLDTIVKPIYDYSESKVAERVPFRKPKRKKVQRRKILKADELLAITGDEGSTSDLGNRNMRMEASALPEDDLDDSPLPDDVLPAENVLLEDLNDVDLKIASERKPKLTAELVATKLSRNRTAFLIKEEPLDSPMVIDSMSEFCRTLGDVPVISTTQPTEAHENEIKKEADSETDEDELLERELASSGYGQSSDNVILDEEPVISTGLSSAVKLAKIKGYLDMQKTRQDARLTTQNISALHYTIEDRSHYDIDDKFSRKERYSGPVTEFREKGNYRPTVALEYLGDDGRKMSMKEAFRYLSHRFHGKGSGKRKTEKRMMKIREEEAMKHMSSVDTPLHTASMLLDKQKELKQPYITLSASKKDPAQLLRKI